MITFRRKALPPPLRAVAWRQPANQLIVVVDDSLSSSEAREAAILAVRRLPQHSARHGIRSASACIALLVAATIGARASVRVPDVPPPGRRRPASVMALHAPPRYLSMRLPAPL